MPYATDPSHNHTRHRLELGLIAVAAAAIAAPYVLPVLGIGTPMLASAAVNLCSTTTGGLTQMLEETLSGIPVVGTYLGNAGWASSITSGVIGIAGVLVGEYIHRHYDRKGHIQWGSIIKYASLATSMLIALPSILSGISMGITYIAGLFGNDALFAARDVLAPTLGFSGIKMAAPAGLAGLAPHLLTCGRAIVPLAATFVEHKNAIANRYDEPYEVTLIGTPLLLKGQPSTLSFQLIDKATGRALSDAEINATHTQKLHTMIVDHSLTDYHHLHPVYDAKRHCFTCEFTPGLKGNYRMWNDVLVKGEDAPQHMATDLSGERGVTIPPRVSCQSEVDSQGLHVSIESSGPLRAGQDGMLTLTIRDSSGKQVSDLEPIMGAYAHLAGFSADGEHFIHSHPIMAKPPSPGEHGFGRLQFHLTPEAAGNTKFFLQIQREGRVIAIPFGQMVAQSQSHASRLTSAAHQHGTMMAA